MIGLDTNVVVRYLTQDDPAQARVANRVFGGLTAKEPGYVPLVVWAEVYWVLTRLYRFAHDDAIDVFEDLLASDEIAAQSEAQVASALAKARGGADFADALILAAADAAGCVESVTFGSKAARRLGYRLLKP
jgi:predicted nucleic-acid-binding protein